LFATGKKRLKRSRREKSPIIDAWIRIDADGKITVLPARPSWGSAINTALMH